MGQQGTYPIGARTLAVTDTATGVVTAATADIPFSSMLNTGLGSNSPLSGMRNRIGNPTFKLTGFPTVPAVTNDLVFERWKMGFVTAGALTVNSSQVAGSPVPDLYGVICAVVTPQTLAATDSYYLLQGIDAQNFNDAYWGTVNAKPITISFWVKGTVAGTYTLALSNRNGNRSYVTTYSVTTSWTRVEITIPGDTTGTWARTGTSAVRLYFDLGTGTTKSTATLNSWTAFTSTAGFGATGAVQFAAQAAASTLAFSCIQLEVSPVATPFEQRGPDWEMAMAQRYDYSLAPGSINTYIPGYGVAANVNTVNIFIPVPTLCRSLGSSLLLTVGGVASDYALVPSFGGTAITCSALPVSAALLSVGGVILTFTATGLLTAGVLYFPQFLGANARLSMHSEPL